MWTNTRAFRRSITDKKNGRRIGGLEFDLRSALGSVGGIKESEEEFVEVGDVGVGIEV
jgi:hypothetical protein